MNTTNQITDNFKNDNPVDFAEIVSKMTIGVAVHEMIFDDHGKPVDYVFVDINEAYSDITGLRKENVIGKNLLKILPNTEKYWIERYGDVVKSGKPASFTDFSEEINKYFSVKAYSLHQNLFVVLVNDITDKQLFQNDLIETKRQIKESEAKYRALIESSGYIFMFIDLNNNINTFSATAAKLYKLFTGEELEKNYKIDNLFNLLKIDLEIIERSKSGQCFFNEIIFENEENKQYFELSVKPIYSDNFEVLGVALIGEDVTRKKEIENEIKQNEEKLKTILEILPLGIIITNDNGKFVYMNKQAEELLDYSLSAKRRGTNSINPKEWKFVNQNYDIIPFEEYPNYQSLILNKVIQNMEMGLLNNDGTFKWFSVSSAPIPIPKYGVVMAFKDITENVAADETNKRLIQDLYESRLSIEENANEIISLNIELENQAGKLKELNQTKDKFFSIISHDLRNPLGGFLQITELLVNDLYKMSFNDIHEVLGELRSSADNIYKLLNNLLDWSRTQTGGMEFHPTDLSIKYLVNNTLDLVKANALNKNITMMFDLDNDYIIFADARMVLTVLRNLITNAIKYTKRGGYISVIVSKEDSYPPKAVVCIEDSGIGIDQKDLQSIFTITANKGRPGTDNEPSTGLGLILCKEFIMKNGGNIWVESVINQGSKFYFSLPLAKDEE